MGRDVEYIIGYDRTRVINNRIRARFHIFKIKFLISWILKPFLINKVQFQF